MKMTPPPIETATEIELTLLAPRADLLAWLERVPGTWSSQGRQDLNSVYWDTPQQTLLRGGLVLRLRQEGPRYWQTLKSSQASHAGLAIRQEWQWPLTGNALDLSVLSACPALDDTPLTDGQLRQQFATDIERSSFTTRFGHSVIQLAVDLGHIHGESGRLEVSEMELELLQGRVEDLYQVAMHLCQQLPLQLSSCSKGERGWRLALNLDPPTPSRHVPEVHRGQDLAATVNLLAHAALQQFLLNSEGFLAHPENGEFLHQMRVAVRRLRAVCGGFKPWLRGNRQLQGLLNQWQVLMQVLGQARDLDVLLDHTLPGILHQLDRQPYQPWLERLQQERQQARQAAQLQTRQSTPLFLATLHYLAAIKDDGTTLESAGRQLLERRWRGLGRCMIGAANPHQIRIVAKKIRYPAEWLASVFRGEAQPTLAYLSALQSQLGDWHDALGLYQRITAAPLADQAANALLQQLDINAPPLPAKPPHARFWRR